LVWDSEPEGAIHLLDGSNLQLYGEKDCSKFSEAWMPLAYIFSISGSSFNWGEIISKQLSTNVVHAQILKEGEAPAFHMASYLLDVICARNVFSGMNLSWHVVELPVHVYFNILWENRYKKSYILICDEFISQVYFILFKKECPRLSVASQENDIEGRPLVYRGTHNLYQGVRGHQSTTLTPCSHPRPTQCGRNMLSNYPAGL
jgi:hypothetical protein